MRLTILGNNGPFPAAGGACSGYLLQSGDTNILIDCGNGTLANLQKIIGIDKLDAVILTHLHSDHVSDMHIMKYAIQIKRKRGTFDKLLKVYAPCEPAEEYNRLDATDAFILGTISDDTRLDIGDIKLSFARMKHPSLDYAVCAECGGKKFVFSGDTSWTDDIVWFAGNADMLMLDAGLLEKDLTEGAAHLSAAQCGMVAARAGAKRLLLTHFWHDYDMNDVLAEARTQFPGAEASVLMNEYII
jgi:ribonuclease BN (tRNA processing enzyme)